MKAKNTENISAKNQTEEKKGKSFANFFSNVFLSNNVGLFVLALITALAYAISKA